MDESTNTLPYLVGFMPNDDVLFEQREIERDGADVICMLSSVGLDMAVR